MCVFLPLILFPIGRERDRVGVYVEVLDICWMLLLDILERERGHRTVQCVGPTATTTDGWSLFLRNTFDNFHFLKKKKKTYKSEGGNIFDSTFSVEQGNLGAWDEGSNLCYHSRERKFN